MTKIAVVSEEHFYEEYESPTVASILPVGGPPLVATPVVITGTFFDTDGPTNWEASINGVACTSVVKVNDTTLNATTPASVAGGPHTVEVEVFYNNGVPGLTGSKAALYTFTEPEPLKGIATIKTPIATEARITTPIKEVAGISDLTSGESRIITPVKDTAPIKDTIP